MSQTPGPKTATPSTSATAMAATASVAPSPANLAKAALRRLAEQRLEPTPENFRKAYEAEAGVPTPAERTGEAEGASSVSSQAEEGVRWSSLITRIMRGAERGGRQWTTARKKESLQRVLEGSKNSAQRLHQRLSQLVQSWDSDTLDNTPAGRRWRGERTCLVNRINRPNRHPGSPNVRTSRRGLAGLAGAGRSRGPRPVRNAPQRPAPAPGHRL